MRDHIFFFLNGQKVQVRGRSAFEMLAPFLRRQNNLTGTKIACAQGSCGSCTVLLGKPANGTITYSTINSCIFPVFNCDGAHIVTVEGLNGPQHLGAQDDGHLSAVQDAIVKCHGAQCGFCTPGIALTLTAFYEDEHKGDLREGVCSALEGNLCRCTGYEQIIDSALSVESSQLARLSELYPAEILVPELDLATVEALAVNAPADEWEAEQQLFMPVSLQQAAELKAQFPQAMIVAGATEVGVPMSVKGLSPREIIGLSQIPELKNVSVEGQQLSLGATARWTAVQELAEAHLPEFGAFLKRWGSPQLRNAGTVAGSLMSGLPISDSLPFFLVSDAKLELVSVTATRIVTVAEYLEDRSILRSDELVSRVLI
ncbi:2Fe-2S iron-sulfur cluster binding domain-containing protein, partial [bacterium]